MSDSRAQTQFRPIAERESEPTAGRIPVLVVIAGEEIGRRFLLGDGRHILGRDPDGADVVIQDGTVSGKHALVQIDTRAGRYGLIDLGSRNGTLLNGRRVESGALRDGDKVFLGDTVLRFSLHDALEEDYHSHINRLMHIDSLTGLYVRRWFDVEYPKAFERSRRAGEPFCVLMMDMDGLKQVNDSHGHQMGSFCISEAGKIIKDRIAPKGVGCRFGGDEFVAFFRNCRASAGAEVAESIRSAIELFDFAKDGVSVAPTITIGVTGLTDDVAGPEDLTRRADAMLYRGKELGRNRVEIG